MYDKNFKRGPNTGSETARHGVQFRLDSLPDARAELVKHARGYVVRRPLELAESLVRTLVDQRNSQASGPKRNWQYRVVELNERDEFKTAAGAWS